MNLELSLIILIVCVAFAISIVTFFKDKRNKINIYFALFCFLTTIWLITNYSSDAFAANQNFARFLVQVDFFSSLVALGFFMLFSLYFPVKLVNFQEKYDKFIIALILITGGLSVTPLIMTSTFDKGGIGIIEGPLYYLYLLTLVIPVVVSLYAFIAKYRKLDSSQKTQIKLVLTGLIALVTIAIATNVVAPFFINPDSSLMVTIPRIGAYSTIIFFGFSAYAILRHGLFDFKIIATESLVIVLLGLLFIDLLSSSDLQRGILRGILLLIAAFGGYKLIQSVKLEIKQKEHLAVLDKKLIAANEQLKKMDKLKDDFISMASHELNTPISAIKGYLSMILDEGIGGKIPDQVKGYLEKMYSSSQRLASMVKDLLNVSRIESGRVHLIYDQKPIEGLIDQAIGEIMSKAKEVNQSLTFIKPDKAMPASWFDVTRIMEVLINIMGNSIKYTDPGGKIEASVSADDKFITVAIKDNGRGIPKEKQDQVFSKFTQVDVLKDEVKGTGLGMYISQKFIELHKGKIWFESEGEGKGTTFYFSLPIIKDKPVDPHEGEGAVLH